MAEKDFDPESFTNAVGKRLAFDFDEAGQAGTPGLIGSAREHPARRQFERLLPNSIGVGSGIIFDSYGGRSRQQDVVLYEKDISPVFSINDTPEATYFPVECVMAIGEVKSTATTTTIADAFEKIAYVKRLKRHSEAHDDELGLGPVAPYRMYGNTMSIGGTPDQQYDQASRTFDQVFGFALFGRTDLKKETFVARLRDQWASYPRMLGMNFVLSLDLGFIEPLNSSSQQFTDGPLGADSIAYSPIAERGFSILVRRLIARARLGRTVPVNNLLRYLGDGPVNVEIQKVPWQDGPISASTS